MIEPGSVPGGGGNHGKVDELLRALGLDGMSKSEVSRVCAELDASVEAFRSRGLEGEHRCVWIDATYHKVRQDGRVQSMATVVAIGVAATGERQILGVDAGPSEDRAFWTAFLRSLVKRGLRGVRLVVSDAREGLLAEARLRAIEYRVAGESRVDCDATGKPEAGQSRQIAAATLPPRA